MVTDAPLIEIVQPVAAEVLSVDAEFLAHVAQRRSDLAGLDNHPVKTSVAMERRAYVGTEMRKTIAPRADWVLVEENHASGAYEWHVGDYAVRLSKTTPDSRRKEAAKHFLGTQGALFETQRAAGEKRATVLIRLMGNPLEEASVDAIWADRKGASPIPLKAIAVSTTERLPSTVTPPAKPSITLPGVRRASESG